MHLMQPIDEDLVDVRRAFFGYPMSTARYEVAADQSGHGRRKRVDDVLDPRTRGIEGAADEEGWLRDGGAVVGGKVLPVPVDVPLTEQVDARRDTTGSR